MDTDVAYNREVARLTASWCLLVLVELMNGFADKYDWLTILGFLVILRVVAIGLGAVAIVRYCMKLGPR